MKRQQTEEMAQLYAGGASLAQIAKDYGVTRQTVWDRFRRAGVEMRPSLRFGEKNHFYRGGGRKRTERGYIKVYVAGRWLFEHRVVMEKMLGRPLAKTEDVHHRNGQKDDNSPENLEIITHASHLSHHKTGRIIPLGQRERQAAALRGQWMHRPDITTDMVVALRQQGLSLNQIALRLGCSWPAVRARLRFSDEHPNSELLPRD